jgi:hypothetical protein
MRRTIAFHVVGVNRNRHEIAASSKNSKKIRAFCGRPAISRLALDNRAFMAYPVHLMAIPTSNELRTALNDDLKKNGPKGLAEVVNDATRKTFTARIDGAIMEFAHKQPDVAFWSGVKYYGSGSNSRIRIPRTAQEVSETAVVAVAKKTRARRAASAVKAKAVTAVVETAPVAE